MVLTTKLYVLFRKAINNVRYLHGILNTYIFVLFKKMNNDFTNRKRYEYKELPVKGLIRSLEKLNPFDSVVVPNALMENHDVWHLFVDEIMICEKRINCSCIFSSKDDKETLMVFKPL